jgi:hypothetical protein
MRIPTHATLLILLCGAAAVPTSAQERAEGSAQGLAEVAKQQEARRGKDDKRDSPKVYTNKDLRGGAASGAEPKATPAAAPARTSAVAPAEPPAAESKSDAKAEVKNEQYWRKRTQSLREQLERDRTLADALQSRVNALTADVISRDDPAQRAKLAVDRQKALNELERLKAAVSDGTKAIADLEEEARRAGVPPGWLR